MPLLQFFTAHRSAAYRSGLQGSTVSEAENTFCMPFHTYTQDTTLQSSAYMDLQEGLTIVDNIRH